MKGRDMNNGREKKKKLSSGTQICFQFFLEFFNLWLLVRYWIISESRLDIVIPYYQATLPSL